MSAVLDSMTQADDFAATLAALPSTLAGPQFQSYTEAFESIDKFLAIQPIVAERRGWQRQVRRVEDGTGTYRNEPVFTVNRDPLTGRDVSVPAFVTPNNDKFFDATTGKVFARVNQSRNTTVNGATVTLHYAEVYDLGQGGTGKGVKVGEVGPLFDEDTLYASPRGRQTDANRGIAVGTPMNDWDLVTRFAVWCQAYVARDLAAWSQAHPNYLPTKYAARRAELTCLRTELAELKDDALAAVEPSLIERISALWAEKYAQGQAIKRQLHVMAKTQNLSPQMG